MKKLILTTTFSALSVLLVACGGTDDSSKKAEPAKQKDAEKTSMAPTIDKKAAIEEAKKITKDFTSSLKAELQKAMKQGGPINALSVCNTKAIPITTEAAKKHNAWVSRVSLKNRNPANVPNDWQKKVLEDFDARAAKGEDVVKMAYAEIVDNNGKKQLRFMKAMPTGDVCLKCHGSNISPEVQAKLKELYPNDKATGYKKGQVRGAVVVLKDLN